MSLIQQCVLGNVQSSRVVGIENNSGLTFCGLGLRDEASVWRLRRVHLNGGSSRRRGTPCRASSGGTRRDEGKIVARTQKRRARHIKGVTPTKPALFDELQAEEEADEQLERFEAIRASEGRAYTSDDSEDDSDEAVENEEDEDVNSSEKSPITDEIIGESDDIAVEEFVKSGDDTYTIKFFPEGKKSRGRKGTRGTLKDVSDTAEETVEAVGEVVGEAGDTVREEVEDLVEQTGEVAGEVGDIAQETAEDVTAIVQEAADETAENLSETGDEVREIVEEGAEELDELAGEVADMAVATAEDVTNTMRETVEVVGKDAEEAAGAIMESLEEVGNQGRKAFEEGLSAIEGQVQEGQVELEENLAELDSQSQEIGDRAVKAFEKISEEVGKSSQAVQESLSTIIEDTAKAGELIRDEAFRLGEVVLTAAGESDGRTPEKDYEIRAEQAVKDEQETEVSQSKNGYSSPGATRKQESRIKSSKPDESKDDDSKLYTGLKVTVAGASGRTGKLLVAELVRKGVPVRALVRDRNKSEARDLAKLSNVEVVQVDLYKYEAVKRALGDSNVVICAVGARSFAFDPIGTYQAEFEGVKNLVAAAKNKGDVKKFVFITTLGVTFLQIVPLIFWKKQAEMYLQRSGLDYTIVRPGGLTNAPGRGGVLMKSADTQFGGSISRQKVAEVCIAAVITPEASEKVIEVVSARGANRSFADQFGSV